MSHKGKIRLLSSALLVIATCGVLLVYMSYSMAHIGSRSATLESDVINIGVDSPGTLEELNVSVGENVNKGDILAIIHSPVLQSDIESGRVNKEDTGYEINSKNDIVLRAPQRGAVRAINFTQGAFVPSVKEIIVINRVDKIYAVAKYRLSPPDYGRIDQTTLVDVKLPDNTQLVGRVVDVSLGDANGQTETTIKAELDSNSINRYTFRPGTPIEVTLRLNGKNLADSVAETALSIERKIGL